MKSSVGKILVVLLITAPSYTSQEIPHHSCSAIAEYPHVTISDYGSVRGADDMAKEIFTNGPIACGIDAAPILNYTTGIVSDRGSGTDHVVSVVGWGKDTASGKQYW